MTEQQSIDSPVLSKVVTLWKLLGKTQRLGQFFMNYYRLPDIHDLYYADNQRAREIINRWMNDQGYVDDLPLRRQLRDN